MSQANGSLADTHDGSSVRVTDRLGAIPLFADRCAFRVWAPSCAQVEVHLLGAGRDERFVQLVRDEHGYHHGVVSDVPVGALYFYRLDGQKERPDPASRAQPQGVHGPSQVVGPDHCFSREDASWPGLPLNQMILYELHVGTFTPAGTFDGVIEKLDMLEELGVNAIEIMPVAQFPGARNWGYDGVYLFAVQDSYGGPLGLKRLVDACHQRGFAVILDVVYNHLGPEGNYLSEFGPYFTDRYRTGWGGAMNLDGPHSDEVRRFLCENACSFVREFHVDGLRLDAVHALFDNSARPFLRELTAAVKEEAASLGRLVHVIAESDSNDNRLLASPERGGYGMSAQWSDDFHHALHTFITGERNGYYQDFGDFAQLVKVMREGFVYTGEYAPSRQRRHGSSTRELSPDGLIVCAQNHDQIGNRMLGERLPALVSESTLRLAAAAVLLGPFVPMLFMGEEYGETAPFQYFVSHGDAGLIEAVRRGRREEFAAFAWQDEPPDPQAEETFVRSRLDHRLRQSGTHAQLFAFYKELIRLRLTIPALAGARQAETEVAGFFDEVLLLLRSADADRALVLLHFGKTEREINHPLPSGRWRKRLDTTSALPSELSDPGTLRLTLQPGAVVVYDLEMARGETGHE